MVAGTGTGARAPESGAGPESHRKTRVLLVDDEENFLSAVSRALQLTGRYEPCMECNGAKALERAREFRPDVVLLDVMMPGIGGEEVAEKLCAADATRGVPIIFVTALVMVKDGVDLPLCCGGDWFLPKPVTLEMLERTIEQVLAQPVLAAHGAHEAHAY